MPMPERQQEVNDAIFNKIDYHAGRLATLEMFRGVTEHRLDNADRRHDEICGQLVRTETKLMARHETQEKMLTELHNDKLMAQGAKNQWKLIGGIIGIIYTMIQVAILIKTFSG